MTNDVDAAPSQAKVERLSGDVQTKLNALQAVDRKIAEVKQELAFLETARGAYLKELEDMSGDVQESKTGSD